jgi:hypothetical protein
LLKVKSDHTRVRLTRVRLTRVRLTRVRLTRVRLTRVRLTRVRLTRVRTAYSISETKAPARTVLLSSPKKLSATYPSGRKLRKGLGHLGTQCLPLLL